MIATRDGNYVAVGVVDHKAVPGEPLAAPRDGDAWIVKLDTLGDVVWQQRLGERAVAASAASSSTSRIRAAENGYWLVGTQTAAGPSGVVTNRDAAVDLVVARLEANGAVRWSRNYDSGPFTGYDFFHSGATAQDFGWDIAPLPDGGAMVAGWTKADLRTSPTSGNVGRGAWAARLDADGNVVWSRRVADAPFENLDNDPADMRVLATAQGGALIVTSIGVRSSVSTATVVTLLDSGGSRRWTRRFERLSVRDVLQIEADYDRRADDDFLLVGNDSRSARSGVLLRLALADGEEVWRTEIDDALLFNAAVQVCRPAPVAVGKICHFNAVGAAVFSNQPDPIAFAAAVTLDGDVADRGFLSPLVEATAIRIVQIGSTATSTIMEITGWNANITPQRLNITAALERLDPTPLELPEAGVLGGNLKPADLAMASDGRVVARTRTGSERFAFIDAFNSLTATREFGATGERRAEQAFDVVEVADGYVVAASSSASDTAAVTTTVVKLRVDGSVQWQSRLAELDLAGPIGVSQGRLADAGEGRVVVAGTRRAGEFALGIARLVLLDAAGAVLWTSEAVSPVFRGSNPQTDQNYVAGVQRLSNGAFVVIGGTFPGQSSGGIAVPDVPWIARIGAAGTFEWVRLLSQDQPGLRATSLRALPDDSLLVAGLAARGAMAAPWAARLGSDGSMTWAQVYEAVASTSTQAARIVPAANGGSLLVAPTIETREYDNDAALSASGRYNLHAIRLDADGLPRSSRVFGGLMDEFPYGLDATPDGGFIIAGRSDSLGEGAEAWFLRLGPDLQVAPGCNAQRSDPLPVNYSASGLRSLGSDEFFFTRPAGRDPIVTGGAALPQQSVGETALARQCAGTAVQEGVVPTTPRYRLTLEQGSVITPGVVTSAPSGISCGTGAQACTANYFANTTVTLRIDPGAGAYFLGWQGCDQSNAGVCLVTMTADRTVSANFRAPDAPSLRVTVAGNGTVSGGGIDCRAGSGNCSAIVPAGTIVNLAARADATEDFLGWDEGCAAFNRASPIAVSMTNSRSCTAIFTGAPPGSPRVSVAIEPSNLALVLGNVQSTPPGILCGRDATDCSQSFAFDTQVRLQARAVAPGWEVETIDCPGTLAPRGGREVQFDAVADVACTARFASDIERLTVQIARDSSDTVGRVFTTGTAAPRALDCTSSCDRPFTRNTLVELRPDTSSSESASWIGCDSTYIDTNSFRNPVVCRVLMDRARHVAAFFVRPNLAGDSINHLAASFLPGSNGGEVRIRWRLPDRQLESCTPSGGTCEVPFSPFDTAVVDIIQAPGRLLTAQEGCDTLTPPTTTDYAQCRVSMSRNRVVRFSFGGGNLAPTARITRTPSGEVAVDEVVSFSAATSTDDQDVAQLSYSWDFDADGVIDATGVSASYAFPSAGFYDVQLRVVDAERASSTAVDTVIVNPGANTPPVASFVFAPTSPQVGTTVSFDASASTDDGRVARYEWDFNGDGTFDVAGTANDARIVTFNYAAAGTYTVRLRVTDDLNASAETTRAVTVVSAANNSDLTLTINGGGAGVVTYTPAATGCSNETGANQIVCVRQFPTGSQVVLRAFAYSGSRIGEWSGCTSVNSAGDECTVRLDGNRSVSLFLIR